MNLNQITLPSHDVERAAEFYERMGHRLIVEAFPKYARFECSEGDTTFSLQLVDEDVQGAPIVIYFEVLDLDKTISELIEKGFVIDQMPREEAWLWREAKLTDPDGNRIKIYHAGINRRYPPWRVSDN